MLQNQLTSSSHRLKVENESEGRRFRAYYIPPGVLKREPKRELNVVYSTS
jgi:hypothetical protein